jgi:hypothetical protein
VYTHNYTFVDLLKHTSKDNINLLYDVSKHIKFNKNGRFNYIYIPYFDIKFLREFITSLEPSSLYTVIPLLSFDGRDDKPHLILSKQILLTKYSSPELINNYLKNKLDIAMIDFEFRLDNEKFHYLVFKYKKIVVK